MRDISEEKYISDGSPQKCIECDRPLKTTTGVIYDPKTETYKTFKLKRCSHFYNMQNPQDHSYYRWYKNY